MSAPPHPLHCSGRSSHIVSPTHRVALPSCLTPCCSTLCFRGRPCASTCLQCGWLTEEGPTGSRPTPVTFPTVRLRAFVREREKRRALLYKKYNLAQVR